MKKIIFLGIVFVIGINLMYAQAPESFNYQAAIRSPDGTLLASQAVNVKITILQGSDTGVPVYSETHSVQSSSNGIINLKVGVGDSPSTIFSEIDWSTSNYYLKIEMDATGGTTYVSIGVAQLLSVPYALHAKVASNLGGDKVQTTLSDTLFVVKDHDGNPVFAVFPDGAKVYVNETAKGKVGGFAVSGRTPGKATEENIFIITQDSTRIYIPETGVKGKVGGFAVSGRTPSKGIGDNIFVVNMDSTRIYIPEGGTKGRVGGFAVSGRTPSKGLTKDFFNISANALADVIDNESRIMWYPEKSALLAGEIYVPSPDSVGQYSISLGYRNIAKGQWSQAMGYQSVARGPYSTAIGYETVADTNSFAFGTGSKALGKNSFAFGAKGIDASGNVLSTVTSATGDYSFAFGLGSTSSGLGSFVMGANSTASGDFATAMGFNNTSEGEVSFTMGYGNTAVGQYSMALGANNQANGIASVTFGVGNTANNYAIVGGFNNTASGINSFAVGSENTTSGTGSIAAGFANNCINSYAVAFGSNNNAGGINSFTVGTGNNASGKNSVSTGDLSIASAENSFAAGRQTQATALGAVAYGDKTVASGEFSTAAGFSTTAESYATFVIGQYNILGGGQKDSWDAADPLFIAGNGTTAAPTGRSNALILYKNGNMTIAGTLTQDSDKRLKENIVKMENVLPSVLKINSVYYEFKNKVTHPKGRHIGFIAQEIEPLFPELVNKDSNGFLSVEYANMTSILLQAVKEQQKIIEEQQKKSEELEIKLKLIIERLDKLEDK